MFHLFYIKEEGHQNKNLSMFCALPQNCQHFLKNNLSILLKQIVWGTQNLALEFL